MLIWLWTGEIRLGTGTRRMMDVVLRDQGLTVSAMTF